MFFTCVFFKKHLNSFAGLMHAMRRAQAAMEFMTTYGFAFIAILIVVGALNYFGVIDPQAFVPPRCTFDDFIDCPSYNIQEVTPGAQYNFDLQVGNLESDDILLYQIGVKEKKGTSYCYSQDIRDPTTDAVLADDADKTARRNRPIDVRFRLVDGVLNCDMAAAHMDALAGSKKRFDVKLYYIVEGATKPTISDGSVITAVS